MKPHLLRTALIGLLLLSIGINVVQFRYASAVEEHHVRYSILDRLMRLSINRSLLVDSTATHSRKALQLLHGSIHMDLLRIHPRIGNFGAAYQERYRQILLDLDEFRREKPDAFAKGALTMDDEMRSRYLELISGGYRPAGS